MLATKMGMGVGSASNTTHEDVVEVMLLLTASRMDALVALSRNRGQTVGQVVRGLIDRELGRAEYSCSRA